MDVVSVGHLGVMPADGGSDLVWIEPSGHETPRGLCASDRLARALEELDIVSAAPQETRDVRDRALLAPL